MWFISNGNIEEGHAGSTLNYFLCFLLRLMPVKEQKDIVQYIIIQIVIGFFFNQYCAL